MERPKIPAIPTENDNEVRALPQPSKSWILAIVCAALSLCFSLLSIFLGFLPAFVGIALGVVAFVFVWKDFELDRKMIALLTLSIVASVIGLFCFVSAIHANLTTWSYHEHYFEDEWIPIDRYDDYFSNDIDESFGGYDPDDGYIWD